MSCVARVSRQADVDLILTRRPPTSSWWLAAQRDPPSLLGQFLGPGRGARAGELLDQFLQTLAGGLGAAGIQQALGEFQRRFGLVLRRPGFFQGLPCGATLSQLLRFSR